MYRMVSVVGDLFALPVDIVLMQPGGPQLASLCVKAYTDVEKTVFESTEKHRHSGGLCDRYSSAHKVRMIETGKIRPFIKVEQQTEYLLERFDIEQMPQIAGRGWIDFIFHGNLLC